MKHSLIIEDQALIALMFQDVLVDLGYTSSDFANSEDEAITLAELRCPDLIIADDQLIEGTGVAAVRHICRHQAIPVVFVTGSATNITRILPDAIVLEKPMRLDALETAIAAAVARPRTYA